MGEPMAAWRYVVSAYLSDALKPFIAATPIAARVAAKDAGALRVSLNNSAAEVPFWFGHSIIERHSGPSRSFGHHQAPNF